MSVQDLPLWIPLAAAGIAAVAAMGGASVGPFIQHVVTERRERRALRLAKAEEIYRELQRLGDELGKLGVELVGEALKLPLGKQDAVFDTGVLRVLLRVYFPGAEHFFEEYEEKQRVLLKPVASGAITEANGNALANAAELGKNMRGGLFLASRDLLDGIETYMDAAVKRLV